MTILMNSQKNKIKFLPKFVFFISLSAKQSKNVFEREMRWLVNPINAQQKKCEEP